MNDRADSPELPDAAALQLYRICQEITMHMIDHAHARRIRIILDKSPQELVLSIGHDGPLVPGETTTSIMQLIDYRLNQISGHPFPASSQDGLRNLSFAVPNPNPPTAL